MEDELLDLAEPGQLPAGPREDLEDISSLLDSHSTSLAEVDALPSLPLVGDAEEFEEPLVLPSETPSQPASSGQQRPLSPRKPPPPHSATAYGTRAHEPQQSQQQQHVWDLNLNDSDDEGATSELANETQQSELNGFDYTPSLPQASAEASESAEQGLREYLERQVGSPMSSGGSRSDSSPTTPTAEDGSSRKRTADSLAAPSPGKKPRVIKLTNSDATEPIPPLTSKPSPSQPPPLDQDSARRQYKPPWNHPINMRARDVAEHELRKHPPHGLRLATLGGVIKSVVKEPLTVKLTQFLRGYPDTFVVDSKSDMVSLVQSSSSSSRPRSGGGGFAGQPPPVPPVLLPPSVAAASAPRVSSPPPTTGTPSRLSMLKMLIIDVLSKFNLSAGLPLKELHVQCRAADPASTPSDLRSFRTDVVRYPELFRIFPNQHDRVTLRDASLANKAIVAAAAAAAATAAASNGGGGGAHYQLVPPPSSAPRSDSSSSSSSSRSGHSSSSSSASKSSSSSSSRSSSSASADAHHRSSSSSSSAAAADTRKPTIKTERASPPRERTPSAPSKPPPAAPSAASAPAKVPAAPSSATPPTASATSAPTVPSSKAALTPSVPASSASAAASLVSRGPLPATLYTADQHILVLGEANFSFAWGLARLIGVGTDPNVNCSKIVTSTLVSQTECSRMCADAGVYLDQLARNRADIWFGVDATKLHLPESSVSTREYDRVVFPFPDTGVDPLTDAEWFIDSNRILLQQFFACVHRAMKIGGEVHMSLRTGKLHDELLDVGLICTLNPRLKFEAVYDFAPSLFPGYIFQQPGRQRPATIEGCSRTYIFSRVA